MSVLVICRKCTLAASRAAAWRVTLSMRRAPWLKKDGTNRQTDDQTPDRHIKHTARRLQRNKTYD